ncbi:hypothetical protein [Aeromonas veronii]|uniref:hypothetical protein n=1 Tax=Aeromonas veronii TaxID=654 RepID=UPI003D1CAC65
MGTIYNGLKREEPAFVLYLNHVPGMVVCDESEYFLGWKFNIPFLNPKTKRCSFLNGISSAFDFVSGESGDITLTSHRLKNVKVRYLGDNKYTVTHKDGTIEVYDGRTMYVSYIIDKYGRTTVFRYNDSGNLLKIYDLESLTSNVISINYETDVVLVTEDAGGIKRTTKIKLFADSENKHVISVSEFGDETLNTRISSTFDDISGCYITAIVEPDSSFYEFKYKAINYDDLQTVQAIATVTRTGFDGQKTIYEYNYSPYNYTGYSPGCIQRPGFDGCIYKDYEYEYDVTESVFGVDTIYTFNRFHLLKLKYIIKDSEFILIEREFNIKPGSIFKQASNYNMVSAELTHMGNNDSDTIIKTTKEYDEFGNLLIETSPERKKTYEYYQKNSNESEGCPPDHDDFFVVHVKKIVTYNLTVEENTTDTKEFTYLSIDGGVNSILPNEAVKKVTLIKDCVHNGSKIIECEYYDNLNYPSKIGLIKKITRFNDASDLLENMATLPKLDDVVTTYRYISAPERPNQIIIEEITTTSTIGGKSSSTIIDASCHLNIVSQTDTNGNTIETSYDLLDRIIRITKNNNVTETFSYQINAQDSFGESKKITHTLPSNRILEYHYNSDNNLTLVAEVIDGWTSVIESYEYTNQLLTKATELDSTFKNIMVETHFNHSLFGVSQIHQSDGKIENISYFFSKNSMSKKSSNINGDTLSEVQYNTLGQPISIQVNGVEIERYTYGQFGDEPTIVDKLLYGGRVHYATEKFTRQSIITTRNTEGIESVTEYKYQSNQLSSPCMVKMTDKNNKTVIQKLREVDAFGRITREGEIIQHQISWTQEHSYQSPQDEIPSETRCYGMTCKQTQLSRTHNKIREETIYSDAGDKFKYNYSYDNMGLLTSSEEYRNDTLMSRYTYTYDLNNNLKSSAFLVDGNTYNLEKVMSSSGRIAYLKNHLGYGQSYFYNKAGRLETKIYHNLFLSISGSYSLNGELEKIILTKNDNGRNIEQIISFTYNELGLITIVDTLVLVNKIIVASVNSLVKYDPCGNIIERKLTNKPDNIISESYAYKGSSPSLYTQATQGVTNSYTYLAPGMLSTISQEFNINSFEAVYQGDAVTHTFINEAINSNFNLNYMSFISNNERGDNLDYDRDGRLISVSTRSDNIFRYHYNPSNRISGIYQNDIGKSLHYIYIGDDILGEVCGKTKSLYITFRGFKIGRLILDGHETELELFGIDHQNTVLMTVEDNNINTYVSYTKYTPYGEKQLWV